MKHMIGLVMTDARATGMLTTMFYFSSRFVVTGIYTGLQDIPPGIELLLVAQEALGDLPGFKSRFPDLRILAVMSDKSDEAFVEALRAGATNCIFKGSPPAEYLQACTDLLQGAVRIKDSVSKKMLLNRQPAAVSFIPPGLLTKREHDLLNLLKDGLQYKEIAGRLGISIETVKRHCSNIYIKLQVDNRTEAVNKLRGY
jgi:NarL family two-component system response regulator LiaR